MTKVIAINAGSSSLKFQLFEMPEEEVITKGMVERIGINNSIFTIFAHGKKASETLKIPDHEAAVKLLLEKLTDLGIIESLEEIEGVGHRIVHGGEYFNDSVLVTDEVLEKIEKLADLAPLHNTANATGIKAFRHV